MTPTTCLPALLGFAALLGGCAAALTETGDVRAAFVGAPAEEVLDKLGTPDNRQTDGGDTLYRWVRRADQLVATPTGMPVSPFNGTGGELSGNRIAPPQTEDQTCTLTLRVNAPGLVTSARTEGGNLACNFFLYAMRRNGA